MTTPARRRLMRDFKKLQEDPPVGVSGAPTDEDIMKWNGIIFGPQGTPFEDGTFKLSIDFSEDYPNKPPLVKFLSKMFHPNVYTDGSICLDILQNRWSPTYDVSAILTSIQSLLDEPNPNSPANALAAQMYQENRREYEKRVQFVVEQSWRYFDDDVTSPTFLAVGQKESAPPTAALPASDAAISGAARSSGNVADVADGTVVAGHTPATTATTSVVNASEGGSAAGRPFTSASATMVDAGMAALALHDVIDDGNASTSNRRASN